MSDYIKVFDKKILQCSRLDNSGTDEGGYVGKARILMFFPGKDCPDSNANPFVRGFPIDGSDGQTTTKPFVNAVINVSARRWGIVDGLFCVRWLLISVTCKTQARWFQFLFEKEEEAETFTLVIQGILARKNSPGKFSSLIFNLSSIQLTTHLPLIFC